MLGERREYVIQRGVLRVEFHHRGGQEAVAGDAALDLADEVFGAVGDFGVLGLARGAQGVECQHAEVFEALGRGFTFGEVATAEAIHELHGLSCRRRGHRRGRHKRAEDQHQE